MREAVAQMKQELGENAVILHTKKYKDGGFLGVGSREMIELTAAIEDEKPSKKELTTEKIESAPPPPPPQTPQPSEPPPMKVRPSSVLSQYKTSGTAEAIALAEKSQQVRAAVDSLRSETPVAEPEPQAPPEPPQPSEMPYEAPEPIETIEPPVEESSTDEVHETIEEPPIKTQKISEPPLPERSASNLLTAAMNIASTAEPEPQSELPPQAMPLPTELSNLKAVEPRPSAPINVNQAASDQAPPAQPLSQTIQQSQPLQPPQPSNIVTLTTEQLAQMQASMVAQAMAQIQLNAAQSQPPQKPSEPPPKSEGVTSEPPAERKPDRKDELDEERREADRQSEEKIKKLETEIAQMKAMLAKVLGRDVMRGTVSLHEALRLQEVNDDILNDMAVTAGAGETLADSQSPEARATLLNYLQANMLFTEGIKLNRHGVRIAALLGTTGVGKTTTLAKIAAKFVLENQVSAALITADTYRISAVEQLRTYSDILGLPLEIVYTPAELAKAINKHRSKDLILIDTAGRSQHNDHQMRELHELLTINQRIEKHLVLSVTTKQSDAKAIIEKFSVCEPDKIIFTKTDETDSLGLILNLLAKQQRLGLSYLTNGQSVPDDIVSATPENLVNLMLRADI